MQPLQLFGNLTQSELIKRFGLIQFSNRTKWNQKNYIRVWLSLISNPIELNQTFYANTQVGMDFKESF